MDEALLPAKRKRDSLEVLYVVDRDEEGAKAGRAAGSEQACGSGGSGDGVTVALLSGHDDPCTNEQYTMWKERLFTDVWLQVRQWSAACASGAHRMSRQRGAWGAFWVSPPRAALTRRQLHTLCPPLTFRRVTRASQRAPGCPAPACCWPPCPPT